MKRVLGLACAVMAVSLSTGWTEMATVNGSSETLPSAVAVSTFGPSDTGESLGIPKPLGVTEHPAGTPFFTWTRTVVSTGALPTGVVLVDPTAGRAFDARTAGDLLSRQASIAIDQTGRLESNRLAGIRGATPAQTLILVDGRPVSGIGFSSDQNLAEIPVDQIDHVEIVRGGFSSLYGPNALGGVINVITKRAQHPGLTISHVGFEKRSFGGQGYRLDFGSRMGPVDYFFFGNQIREGGFRDHSDAKTHTLGGNIGYSMGKAGKLLVDVATYHLNASQPGQLSPDLPVNQYDNHLEKASPTPDANKTTQSRYVRSSWLLPLPQDSQASFRIFDTNRQMETTTASRNTRTDVTQISRGAEVQVTLPHGFMMGSSFIHDRLDSRDLVSPANNYVGWVEDYGIFAQAIWTWRRLSIIPGGRYDHHSQTGDSKNPRVQMLLDPTEWLRLSGSAGRSFRAPSIEELFSPSQGNIALRAEKAWQYDGGFEIHYSSFSLKTTYFRALISDAIQVPVASPTSFSNLPKARRHGVEIEITHIVNSYVRDSWNYTYLENNGVPSGGSDAVPLRLSPRHTVNHLAVFTPTKDFSIESALRYRSSRFEGDNETGVKLPSIVTWDVRFNYQIRQLELYIGANNVANKRYEDRSGYPLPGRTYFGGASLRLWG